MHGFVEEFADQRLQRSRPELEIDIEVDDAHVARIALEPPVIGEITEWTAIVDDVDALGVMQGNLRGKFLAEHLEADHHVGDEGIRRRASNNPASDTPGQKLRVALDVGDQIKHLFCGIRDGSLFGVSRHAGVNCLCR